MYKRQLFREFVNECLVAAALEISGQYKETLAECQEEISRSQEKIRQLQHMLEIQAKIKLQRTDVQQLFLPEPPQIKEEQSDTKDSIFTSPRVKTHCDTEDSAQRPPLHQTPTVETRDSSTNTTEKKIKAEPVEEDYGAPEPASDSQPLSELPACPKPLPTRVVKSPRKSRRTLAKCSRSIPSLCSSPGPSLRRAKASPSPWTRPISSSSSGRESEDVSTMEAENKTAEKPHQCEECDKAFSSKSTLLRHRRIHTGEKPYQCEQCDNAFSRKHILVHHLWIHTGEKPYHCELCDKAFRQNSHLVEHRRIHTGEKPYHCGQCDKAFSLKGSLIKHRRIHTGEKPYHCGQCDKAFSQKGSLVQHRRIHTGEKPYHGGQCDKAFSQQGSLIKHRRIHTE